MTRWLKPLAAFVWAAAAATGAQAQTYPTKTVTIVVTAAAGGVTDVVARAIGQRLSEKWGQQVVIENKGGAGHILGAAQVANAAPDGHTLLIAEAGTYVINPNIYPKEKLTYDVEKDLIQITGLVRIHHAVIASPSFPANSFGELVALAKAKPGTLTYGTAGVGSGPHLNMVRLENDAGVKLVAVHYRGATPALTDVIGGHTNMMLISVGSAIAPADARNVKLLAIGSPQRLARLPDLPTAGESVPGLHRRHLVRALHHRQDAARDRDEDQRGRPSGHCRACDPGAVRHQAALRADDELARGVCPVHQDRNGEMGEGDPRAEFEDRALGGHDERTGCPLSRA